MLLRGRHEVGLAQQFVLFSCLIQHWQVVSGASAAAGVTELAAVLRPAGRSSEHRGAMGVPQVPTEQACHSGSYGSEWHDSFSLLLNGRAQESSLW